MKQLVVKLVVLAALLLAVRAAFIPFYEPEYERRSDTFRKGSYTTVFVGSSRTKCGVIPAYFDQLLQYDAGSSYNFGVDTGSMPTTLDWSTKLIDGNPSLKHIIIEISGSGGVQQKDRDKPALVNGSKTIRDISRRVDHVVLWILRPALTRDVTLFDHNRALDQLGEPCRRHEEISDDEIQMAAGRSKSIERDAGVNAELAAEYQERITRFLDYARSRGVSVHFFVPPLVPLDKEAESIRAIYRFLPAENKIGVNREGPIYSSDSAGDAWHLNQRGAFMFTRRLAQEVSPRNTGGVR
jgi:hypothetical protein